MKMKFGDFLFPANPAYMEVSASVKTNIEQIFGENSRVQCTAVNPTVVKGGGDFWGKEGENICIFLQHILKKRKPYPLLLPSGNGFDAYLTDFTYKKSKEGGPVNYSFVFVENCTNRQEEVRFSKVKALENENAFDIASRTGVCVSDIMNNNGYKTPFEIKKDDVVIIR